MAGGKAGGPQIYALVDPRDGCIRYIGKANSASDRFKGHLSAASKRKTPVYRWVRELFAAGMLPELKILLDSSQDWQADERRLISEHRISGKLLNVADGGDQPFCAREVRAANGRLNAGKRNRRKWELMLALGAGLKAGLVSERTKALMRSRPDVFGQFAQHLG
jgi:hypothetical protein